MTKFEVGKKYRQVGAPGIFEPLFTGDESAFGVYRYNEGVSKEMALPHRYIPDHYVEYKEPRKVERWVNIYERLDGPRFAEANWPTRDDAIRFGGQRSDYLDTIKITWTEGQ